MTLLNLNSLFVVVIFFFGHNKCQPRNKFTTLIIHIFVGDIQMTTL